MRIVFGIYLALSYLLTILISLLSHPYHLQCHRTRNSHCGIIGYPEQVRGNTRWHEGRPTDYHNKARTEWPNAESERIHIPFSHSTGAQVTVPHILTHLTINSIPPSPLLDCVTKDTSSPGSTAIKPSPLMTLISICKGSP